jgi:hypothetical protein
MDSPPWARRWIEYLVRGSCNHFPVTADKGPCVVDDFAGLSVCVYVFMCLCIYIFIESNMDWPLWARKLIESLERGCCNHFVVTADMVLRVVDGSAGLSLFVY